MMREQRLTSCSVAPGAAACEAARTRWPAWTSPWPRPRSSPGGSSPAPREATARPPRSQRRARRAVRLVREPGVVAGGGRSPRHGGRLTLALTLGRRRRLRGDGGGGAGRGGCRRVRTQWRRRPRRSGTSGTRASTGSCGSRRTGSTLADPRRQT
jgi:hypothetical protein